ncbi:MAG: (Fe-S)-binding protein [Alphaproteobacteria bacterium]|nr:(Fe-S)-binding protein [Alphaproteobacteria bacterium]
MTNEHSKPPIGLFVTCLADLYRPSVAFAAVKLLEDAGATVEVPQAQTCCGQPAFNNGDLGHARKLALQVIDAFAGFDYVVGPSGSCMGTIKTHYVELFEDDPEGLKKAQDLAERSHELISFLTDVMGVSSIEADYQGTVTYHDSCAGLRELGVHDQPRKLLVGIRGLGLNELEDSNVCCGFGGTFCVKYPEISGRMADDKCSRIKESGADTLLGGDLGCLLNIAGRMRRRGEATRVFHVAEVLAGMTGGPGIGDGED